MIRDVMGTTLDLIALLLLVLSLIAATTLAVHRCRQDARRKGGSESFAFHSRLALEDLAEPVIFMKDHVITLSLIHI